jgi:hypothetical protein
VFKRYKTITEPRERKTTMITWNDQLKQLSAIISEEWDARMAEGNKVVPTQIAEWLVKQHSALANRCVDGSRLSGDGTTERRSGNRSDKDRCDEPSR